MSLQTWRQTTRIGSHSPAAGGPTQASRGAPGQGRAVPRLPPLAHGPCPFVTAGRRPPPSLRDPPAASYEDPVRTLGPRKSRVAPLRGLDSTPPAKSLLYHVKQHVQRFWGCGDGPPWGGVTTQPATFVVVALFCIITEVCTHKLMHAHNEPKENWRNLTRFCVSCQCRQPGHSVVLAVCLCFAPSYHGRAGGRGGLHLS